MELIVISNPEAIANEAQYINNLLMSGLSVFHLRKPTHTAEQINDLIRKIDKKHYAQIALHQHHQTGIDLGITRLHYTEHNRNLTNSAQWQLLKNKGYILSTSVHNLTLLPSLKYFDYTFYGPVFNSISKAGYKSKLPAGFYLDKSNISTKVIALGGIDASNLNQIQQMNFDGAAILGALWSNTNSVVETFKTLKEKLTV